MLVSFPQYILEPELSDEQIEEMVSQTYDPKMDVQFVNGFKHISKTKF